MKIYINPPPSDAKCEVCRKHVLELEAFGGAGDPLVGDFKGAKLVKTFRAELRGTDNEQVGASWECRDCIVLDDEEYDKKRNEL
jgi:hypothetical protein